MKKLILIIMFLLLCPSLIFAEEKSGSSDEAGFPLKACGNDSFEALI